MIPWQYLQSFAAIVESGSLSGAARALQLSQPTLSRHLQILEEQLNTRLFIRRSTGLQISPAAQKIYQDIKVMADHAARLQGFTPSPSQEITGSVRLSASQIVASYLLPKMLTDLHRQKPLLQIEVQVSNLTDNLTRREADIAIRMYRPTQNDIFIKKVGALTLGIFAHKEYFAKHAPPQSPMDFLNHSVIGYDRNPVIIDNLKRFGLNVEPSFFTFRSDDQTLCWEMVKAGYGIGFMQMSIARQCPDLVQIFPDLDIGSLPVWLAAHKELKNLPRIRATFDHLAESFGAL